MSFLTSFLRIISLGLYKEPKKAHSDYFQPQDGKFWYWRKDILLVTMPDIGSGEIREVVDEWQRVGPANAPRLFLAADPDEADIVVEIGDAVKKGGVTVRLPVKGTTREIAWAKVVISDRERGKRKKAIALHEIILHAVGGISPGHEGAYDSDAGHSKALVTSLSAADIATIRKIYENRPPAV